jgi:hypothetical protein
MERCRVHGTFLNKSGECKKCTILKSYEVESKAMKLEKTDIENKTIADRFDALVQEKKNSINLDITKYNKHQNFIMVDPHHNKLCYNDSTGGKNKSLNFVGLSVVEIYSYDGYSGKTNEKSQYEMFVRDVQTGALNKILTKHETLTLKKDYYGSYSRDENVSKVCFCNESGESFWVETKENKFPYNFTKGSPLLFKMSEDGLKDAITYLKNNTDLQNENNILDLDKLIKLQRETMVEKLLNRTTGLYHLCPHCKEPKEIYLYDITYIRDKVGQSILYENDFEKTMKEAFKGVYNSYHESKIDEIICSTCGKNMMDENNDFFDIIVSNKGKSIGKYGKYFYCIVCNKVEQKHIYEQTNGNQWSSLVLDCNKGLFKYMTSLSTYINPKLRERIVKLYVDHGPEPRIERRLVSWLDCHGYCRKSGHYCNDVDCYNCKSNSNIDPATLPYNPTREDREAADRWDSYCEDYARDARTKRENERSDEYWNGGWMRNLGK